MERIKYLNEFYGLKIDLSVDLSVDIKLDNINMLQDNDILYEICGYLGDDFRIKIYEKLDELGDYRGAFSLAEYYMDDREKNYKYLKRASELNSCYAKINLYNNYEKDVDLLYECLLLGYYFVISDIIIYHIEHKNINECIRYLVYGIYKNSEDCLKIAQNMYSTPIIFYQFLNSLSFSNSLTKNKIQELLPLIPQSELNQKLPQNLLPPIKHLIQIYK